MKDSLSSSTFVLTISTLVFAVSGYLTNIILGRLLGPADYGIYGIIISFLSAVNIIQAFGLPQAVSKFTSEIHNSPDQVLKSGLNLQIVSSLLITIFFFLLATPIAMLLKDRTLIPYLQYAALILPLYGIFALYTNYYNGLHNFKKQALVNTIYSFSKTIGIIALSLSFKIYGALSGFILAPLIALFFAFHIPKTSKHFSYKKLILFSLPLIGFSLVLSLQQTIDLYFVKRLLPLKELTGYYAANQNISVIPFFALSAFSVIIFPSISRNISLNLHEESRKIIRQSLRLVILLLVPSVFLTSATSRQLIEFLYSSSYNTGAASLSILTFGIGFLTLFSVFANILNGSGKPRLSFAISLCGVLITSLFCILLIPLYGLIGAAISTSIGTLFSMCVASFFVYKQFNTLVPIINLSKIISCGIIIYFLAIVLQLPLILLPLKYIVLFLVYFSLLILVKELNKTELSKARSLIPAWVPLLNK